MQYFNMSDLLTFSYLTVRLGTGVLAFLIKLNFGYSVDSNALYCSCISIYSDFLLLFSLFTLNSFEYFCGQQLFT